MKSRFFAVTTFSTFVLAGSLATGSLALAQSSTGVSSDTAASTTPTTTFTVPANTVQSLDYSNVKSLDQSISPSQLSAQASESLPKTFKPGFKLGSRPNSQAPKLSTQQLISALTLSPADAVVSDNSGTSKHPFTTARNPQTTGYPYSPSGRLFFNIGSSTYVCSASVIQRGVVVTAAHCVANFGAKQYYSNWQFVPAYNNGAAPYRTWTASKATVLTSYYDGTDHCTVTGVVCDNDVAVLVMNPQSSYNVGDYTGWYGIAYDGYAYIPFLGKSLNQLTQIGYPVSLDNGVIQERNDSLTYIDNTGSNQQIIGSLMTGGSSGGPWVINYGQIPNVSAPNTLGQYSTSTPVVSGVTSWGYNDPNMKEQGASLFTRSNILALYNTACTNSALLACK